ncbi:MAG: transglutaminase-like domain-containing protein [Gammaproteobacteria bacterium]|nr:transglutaminase-like domain-containing protein [Gammaproteobacteria bacterium]MBU1654100.1 transglutaminase-like domain-containing protein [Gammaproteobacteria bacterium]MBU1961683.1 transglutaminase-like domain-containing protein [Gammaproteobacteria bacterium]
MANADEASLKQFFLWHSSESLQGIFSWTPKWAPPDWRVFIRHGIPDWPPILRNTNCYLSLAEFNTLRDIAIREMGDSGPEEAAYRLFRFVNTHIEWGPVWGSSTPTEILARRRGGSLHLAQVLAALLRALFIPVRLVEEIALAPDVWREQARNSWHGIHPVACEWMGDDVFYHPFCEARIGATWVPIDPQRGQFGIREFQQHLRVPQLLKIIIRTWEDYGQGIARTRRYTLAPLVKEPTPQGLSFKRNLQSINLLLGQEIERGGVIFDTQKGLLRKIEAEARDLWLNGGGNSPCFLYTGQDYDPTVHLFFQASIHERLYFVNPSDDILPVTGQTWILTGSAISRLTKEAYWMSIKSGARIAVFYDSWGDGEAWINHILEHIGGSLGDWIIPPRKSLEFTAVTGYGRLKRGCLVPSQLDLRLSRSLRGLHGCDGKVVVHASGEGREDLVACTLPVGKGRLTLAPIVIPSRADPYSVSATAGCHRRLLGALLGMD